MIDQDQLKAAASTALATCDDILDLDPVERQLVVLLMAKFAADQVALELRAITTTDDPVADMALRTIARVIAEGEPK